MVRLSATAVAASLALGCAAPPGPAAPSSAAAGAAGVLAPAPPNAVAGRTWVSPSGRTVREGDIDPLGWVLPLDVVRARPPRPPNSAPSVPSIPVARQPAGPGPFPETRLGPDDGHTQNETSIAVEGSTLVAGWNSFTDSSLTMGAARSHDDGETLWTSSSSSRGHTTMSDPAVDAGGAGRWYYGYIASGGATGSDLDVFVRRSTRRRRHAGSRRWRSRVDANFDDKPYIAAAATRSSSPTPTSDAQPGQGARCALARTAA